MSITDIQTSHNVNHKEDRNGGPSFTVVDSITFNISETRKIKPLIEYIEEHQAEPPANGRDFKTTGSLSRKIEIGDDTLDVSIGPANLNHRRARLAATFSKQGSDPEKAVLSDETIGALAGLLRRLKVTGIGEATPKQLIGQMHAAVQSEDNPSQYPEGLSTNSVIRHVTRLHRLRGFVER